MALLRKSTAVVAHPDAVKRDSFAILCSEFGLDVLAKCSDGASTIQRVSQLRPLVVLVSANLAAPAAKETIRRIRDVTQADCGIVLLCADLEEASFHEINGIGANAYAPVNRYIEDISEAIYAAIRPRRTPPSTPQPFVPGNIVGRYRIERSLGLGGVGAVYQATDTKLERVVAIKCLPPEFAIDRGRVMRFREQARALASLDHPNIVAIYDLVLEGEVDYLVTEYVPGRSLRFAMEVGDISHLKAIDLVIQTADGLGAAHMRSIIHRNINPDTLMVTESKQIKIIDFGIALSKSNLHGESTMATQAGTIVGTIDYCSPEQAAGLEVNHSTDIFSLGVVLYELLFGRHPFRRHFPAETLRAIIHDSPPPMEEIGLAFGAAWPVIAKALEKQPGQRYGVIADFAADLRALRQTIAYPATE